MTHSIYDVARTKPDEWVRRPDCTTDDHVHDLDETGGMLCWCTCCELFNSPNRPCFCGCMILQRQSDGMFWCGESGWLDNWKHAEHFFAADSAAEVARVLVADNGLISVFLVHTGWQKEAPESVMDWA